MVGILTFEKRQFDNGRLCCSQSAVECKNTEYDRRLFWRNKGVVKHFWVVWCNFFLLDHSIITTPFWSHLTFCFRQIHSKRWRCYSVHNLGSVCETEAKKVLWVGTSKLLDWSPPEEWYWNLVHSCVQNTEVYTNNCWW